MKVVLFCGGLGLRLRGVTGVVPKPMVPVGGRPLLWHIMKYYAHFGHRDFLLCVGHQADVIRRYFGRDEFRAEGWRVTFVDTPVDASIGERFFAVREHVGDGVFLANYGDTVTDVALPTLIDAHRASGKVASLLSVRPNYTFNVVTTDGSDLVAGFQDIAESGIRINGGYFVFEPRVFDYLEAGEDLPEMFHRLIAAGELVSYAYDGFWAPMDTLKDKERLEELVSNGGSVWQVWEPAAAASAG
ncbi:MAG TPA: sugar phosphate nucleotidyltransferase [Gaiellaceae bacterium]|nr:sugar phosphate nucleotidyltransferase [Gaiellaceae bacterium]